MRAKKTDDNQKEIVKAFRDLGATVFVLSSVGRGLPDLLIGYRNRNFLVEIKDGDKSPSKRRLTKEQKEFMLNWRGHISVIMCIDDVIEFINRIC